MLYWRETKVAKIKIANLPDNLISVKLFIAKINVSRVYHLTKMFLITTISAVGHKKSVTYMYVTAPIETNFQL